MLALRVLHTDLVGKTIRLGRTAVKGVSVYPLFRKTGTVDRLMVMLPDEPGVFVLPFTKGMITVRPWGAVRMGVTPDQLLRQKDFQPEQLDGLFHYDTQWVSMGERFAACRSAEVIGQTNCAAAIREQVGQEIGHLRFSRDLSTLESITLRSRWPKPATILPAPAVLSSMADAASRGETGGEGGRTGAWLLDPIWRNGFKSGYVRWG